MMMLRSSVRCGIRTTRYFASSAVKLPSSDTIFIDGKYCGASDGSRMPVHSPATGAELTSIANGTESDVDRAVQAARASYEARSDYALSWKALTFLTLLQGVWGRGKTTVEERCAVLSEISKRPPPCFRAQVCVRETVVESASPIALARLSDPDTLKLFAQARHFGDAACRVAYLSCSMSCSTIVQRVGHIFLQRRVDMSTAAMHYGRQGSAGIIVLCCLVSPCIRLSPHCACGTPCSDMLLVHRIPPAHGARWSPRTVASP